MDWNILMETHGKHSEFATPLLFASMLGMLKTAANKQTNASKATHENITSH